MTTPPLPADADKPEETMWQGRFITAKRRGRWEYVGRARGIRAAVILAVDNGEAVLVEQFRVALGKPCLELPAGLIGDEEGSEDEGTFAAAERELVEETGFAAARWEDLGEFASSPGMMSETFSLLRANGLTRIGDGGGVEGEGIIVHTVPIARLGEFVAGRRAAGTVIDVRLLLLLGAGMLEENEA